MERNETKRALCISGGGAKGAWGGGAAQSLYENLGREWDTFVGCSTGSLLITMIPLENFALLKHMYTNVNNDNIFSVNPYNKRDKISICNAIKRMIKGKTSLGEFGGLRSMLMQNFTSKDFSILKTIGCDVYVTATNMTKGIVEFFSNKDMDYLNFVNMVIASTSVPMFADLVNNEFSQYLDGGVMDHVPIKKAIDLGADEIDVIILRTEKPDVENWKADNMFDVLVRTIDLMHREISMSDVMIAQLAAQVQKDVKINFYYTPYTLCKDSLIFNKELMLKWWQEGYDYVKQVGATKSYQISKNNDIAVLK